MEQDTIYALASGAGRAGVAVVRVSGSRAGSTLEALTGAPLPEPRRAVLALLRDSGGSPIDEGLVLFFASPNSYTGEDIAEFHVHGGRAIIEALFVEFGKRGLRPAESGEFTRRAVEHGKFDLTRAEAVADLVEAETEAQRHQALRQYGGELWNLCEGWRSRLLQALAWAEAAIDFSDDELPADVLDEARSIAAKVSGEVQGHLDDGHRGERVREGLFLAVIGPPNAGKSSLLNALAKRDLAIVAATPGTTRDVIEVRLDLGGFPVTVADTAGLRASQDAVEAEGVRRALERARSADLVLLLRDGSVSADEMPLPDDVRPDLVVWNKTDLPWQKEHDGIALSLRTGEGLEQLLEVLGNMVGDKLALASEAPVLTRRRHRDALKQAVGPLIDALSAPQDRPEILAEDLRLALRAIGRVTGRVHLEELLDIVFRDFCIGK